MTPRGSATLVSKMVFSQSLVVLIFINSLKARSLPGPHTNLRDVLPKNDSDGQKKGFFHEPVGDIRSELYPVKLENNVHLTTFPAIETKNFEKTMEKTESEGRKSPAPLLSPIFLRGDSSEQEIEPLRVERTLRPLSKKELDPFSSEKVESKHLKGMADGETFQPLISLDFKEESTHLSDCIKKLQSSGFFPNALSNLGDLLSTQEHDTLPPLPNEEIKTEPYQMAFEKGSLGELHEPLPPTLNQEKLPNQSLIPIKDSPTIPPVPNHVPSLQISDAEIPAEAALPITEGHFPAPVVPSGPYPAEVSILKEIPAVHVAEPLPPLKNGAPKEKLPGHFPTSSPFISS